MPDLYYEIKALRLLLEAESNNGRRYDAERHTYWDVCERLNAILSRHEKPEQSAPQKVERWRCAACKETFLNDPGVHYNVRKQCFGPVERVEEPPQPIEFIDRPYAKRGE